MSLPRQLGYRREKEPRDRMNTSKYRDYLEKNVVAGMDIYSEGVLDKWDEDFAIDARLHGKKNNNLAVEYVESWNKEESDKMGYEKLYEIGIENAKKAFPGFSFVVVPHVNKGGNFHTHVLYNTVSDDGSKRMYSDWKNRNRWNQTVDKSAREHGLTTVSKDYARKGERMSRSAHKMMRRGAKAPHQLQIMQKADFARRIALSIEEFITVMGDLGIGVTDRGSVLSYKHPARNRAIRGRTLGQNYQKPGLEKTFSKNAKEFKERPALPQFLKNSLKELPQIDKHSLHENTDFPFHLGGHQCFLSESPDKQKALSKNSLIVKDHVSEELAFASYISPFINEAKSFSIPEYCKQNNIPLVEVGYNKYSLKGREHIQIEGTQWSNIKKGKAKPVTQGSLIEFVANHKQCNLLEAISEITGNKRLLFLQPYIGTKDRKYMEFHVPVLGRKNEKESLTLLTSLAKSMGHQSGMAQWLYKTKRVQVRTTGVIRFLSGDSKAAVDYEQKSGASWSKTIHGRAWSGFISQQGSSEKLHVFQDPFSFFEYTQGRGIMAFKASDNVLVLNGKGDEALDFFLAQKPKVKHLDLFGFSHKKMSPEKQLQLSKNGLSLNFEDASRSKNKDRGMSLSR